MTSIRVTTAPGTNASRIADAYVGVGVALWRNSVDRCDADGGGRVFCECLTADDAEHVASLMDDDDDVTSYEILS